MFVSEDYVSKTAYNSSRNYDSKVDTMTLYNELDELYSDSDYFDYNDSKQENGKQYTSVYDEELWDFDETGIDNLLDDGNLLDDNLLDDGQADDEHGPTPRRYLIDTPSISVLNEHSETSCQIMKHYIEMTPEKQTFLIKTGKPGKWKYLIANQTIDKLTGVYEEQELPRNVYESMLGSAHSYKTPSIVKKRYSFKHDVFDCTIDVYKEPKDTAILTIVTSDRNADETAIPDWVTVVRALEPDEQTDSSIISSQRK